jgi:hypothetical protein
VRFRAKASETPRQAFGPSASARTPTAPQRGSDYARLSRQVKQAGLLERRPGSEASFGGSYAQALRYLNTIGRPPRPVAGPPALTSATAALASDALPAARQ